MKRHLRGILVAALVTAVGALALAGGDDVVTEGERRDLPQAHRLHAATRQPAALGEAEEMRGLKRVFRQEEAARGALSNAEIGEHFVAIFNEQDTSIVDEIFAPDFVAYVTGSPTPTLDREGWKAYLEAFRASFPDLRLEVKDMMTTDDRVILRVVLHGTQMGAFQYLPPSGKEVAFEGVAIHRIENGQVVEHWGLMDLLSLMHQLTAETGGGTGEGGVAEDAGLRAAFEASNAQFVAAFNRGDAAGVASRYAEDAQRPKGTT